MEEDICKIIFSSFPGTSYTSIVTVLDAIAEGKPLRNGLVGADCGVSTSYRIANLVAHEAGYETYKSYRKDILKRKF